MNRNDSGTHEWGTFRVTSTRWLSEKALTKICSIHGMGGQSFSFNETKNENNFIYEGTYDCYSD